MTGAAAELRAGATARFSKTPGQIETPPPALSQHTEEILCQLGYSLEEQKALKEKMVI